MKENRITEAFARGRIAYPRFEADAENERRAADTLNGFYRALRDGAAAYIEEIAHNTEGISRTYTADYTLRREGDVLVVEYLLLQVARLSFDGGLRLQGVNSKFLRLQREFQSLQLLSSS